MSQAAPAGVTPLARADDPATSKYAASTVGAFAGRHRDMILGALRRLGPSTYEEIAAEIGMEPVAVGRRLHELADKHLIDADGVRPTSKKKPATVWRAR